MRLVRTANAGVLLELDGKRLLLDGVCREVAPYPATSCNIRQSLLDDPPDFVAVTHFHDDHCDIDFQTQYEEKTGRRVISPAFTGQTVKVGNLCVTALTSRHIGKKSCDHVSYLVEGSKRILFTGDASPLQWKNWKADVLIAPFAYASTETAWRISREIAPVRVIVHLPEIWKDTLGLRTAVVSTAGEDVFIPEMEEFIQIDF